MKLSALLLLAGASMCAAQSRPVPPSQTPNVAIVDDQAIGHAEAAMAAAASIDQLQKMVDRVNQANCPVVLTSAWLTPHLMLLNSPSSSSGNGVDLEFRNASGKAIRSMELSATILVKKSKYDLGYLPPVKVRLSASGIQTIDSAFAQLRRLSLPSEMHPALVQGVTLDQVTFEDGSVWSPRNDQYCGLKPDGMRSIGR